MGETAYNDALIKYNSDLSNYDNVIDPSVIPENAGTVRPAD